MLEFLKKNNEEERLLQMWDRYSKELEKDVNNIINREMEERITKLEKKVSELKQKLENVDNSWSEYQEFLKTEMEKMLTEAGYRNPSTKASQNFDTGASASHNAVIQSHEYSQLMANVFSPKEAKVSFKGMPIPDYETYMKLCRETYLTMLRSGAISKSASSSENHMP